MTGATGFVGVHLLHELLLTTTVVIECLIRADNNEHAWFKLCDAARMYHINLAPFMQRLHIIVGDLAVQQFGLCDDTWEHLSVTIGAIYHCGAEINMVKSFAQLKATNLLGTKEVARLALNKTRKKLYYLSTLSVFVATDRNTGVCEEDDRLEQTQFVYGGYAQSKWAAEYFLLNSSLDLSIFRLGLVTGDSQTGVSSKHDYLSLFILGLQKVGHLPSGDWEQLFLDVTPVDYAVKAVAYLSMHKDQSCFHIANAYGQGFSLKMIVDGMLSCGMILTVDDANVLAHDVDNSAFAAQIALCRLQSVHSEHFKRYRAMDLFQATDITFDQARTRKGLYHAPFVCPKADEHLLTTYLNKITDGA